MGKHFSSLRLTQSPSNPTEKWKNKKMRREQRSSTIKSRSVVGYLPNHTDNHCIENTNTTKLYNHEDTVTTLTTIQPDICISGGKDKLLLVQVLKI